MKLHLGCGQRYLQGYKNIDFPPSEHTVQDTSVADEYLNLLEMKVAKESVEEIRLHHVFEHFDRPTALALLFAWNSWLKKDGLLHIEVPDFFLTSLLALCPFAPKRKKLVATRHLFGSHEAPWAIHAEGWTKTSLKRALSLAGLETLKTKRSYWRGTFNLEIIAVKKRAPDFSALESFFKLYTLDESDSEKRLLNIWMELFKTQYEKSKA